MYIICNGLYKSGSTFVYMVSRNFFNSSLPPKEFSGTINPANFRLDPKFIEDSKFINNLYVAKTHLYDKKKLDYLMQSEKCFLIFTNRDTSDILKSHFFHFTNERFYLPFLVYALTIGLLKAIETDFFRKTIVKGRYYNCIMNFNDFKSGFSNEWRCLLTLNSNHYSESALKNVIKRNNKKGDTNIEGTGMRNREWFFSRKEKKFSELENFILKLTCSVSKVISHLPLIGFLVVKSFLLTRSILR